MESEDFTKAVGSMDRKQSVEHHFIHDDFNVDEFIGDIFKGIDIKSDPVLSSIYLAKEINQLLLMRKKNRIMLQDSCSLIGVIDADGHLEEGEVFVQIRKDNVLQVNEKSSSDENVKLLKTEMMRINKINTD